MPKLDLTYPNIMDLFPEHLDPKRTESAAFLIWYLENYLRLDAVEAVDSICDQSGDKGVDGIYINEDANTVDVYQSRISQKKTSSTGDKALREFAGTLKQFEASKSVADLQRSAGKADVARLIERLDLANKINDYELKGVFVSNTELDANGEDYLRSHSGIRFIGRQELINTFISSDRNTKVPKPLRFDISGHEASTYVVDKTNKAVIAPLKAAELIRMDGISNQALFALNVRGPLGKTQVNRDIAKSVQDKKRHKLFPLFHNGITIIADKVQATDDDIRIENYYVVNGCQSLSELYKNRAHITDNLRVLVKLIEIDASSDLSETVTIFSNNQNGVKARDFKSNNPIQIRLQNEIRSRYGKEFHYEIKRGEDNAGKKTITNELAGLYLLAFDLKRPWDTHRKYQIFEDEHAVVFGRPAVDAHRIILCALLAERVSAAIQRLDNSLFAKYVLTRFLILYILRLILEDDPLGKKLIADPSQYVSDKKMRAALVGALDKLLNDVVIDLNAELAQVGEDFDYRGKLRDEVWVKALAHRILADHAKLVARGRIDSFERDFETAYKEKANEKPKLRFLKRKK